MIRPILKWPDPALAVVCERIDPTSIDTVTLFNDLADTMNEASGLGLAAPQIGEAKRAFVIASGRGSSLFFTNPRIVARSGVKNLVREGCLSMPGFFETVRRDSWVVVEDDGRGLTRLDGRMAQSAQHEIEHLDGQTFLQHLSFVKRNRAKQMFAGGGR